MHKIIIKKITDTKDAPAQIKLLIFFLCVLYLSKQKKVFQVNNVGVYENVMYCWNSITSDNSKKKKITKKVKIAQSNNNCNRE